MPGKHWPPEAIEYAKHLRAQGYSNTETAAGVTAKFNRPCLPKYIYRWNKDAPVFYSSRQPWNKKWWARARELYKEGMNYTKIANIITVESGRECKLMTVKRWIGVHKVSKPLPPKVRLERLGSKVIERHPTPTQQSDISPGDFDGSLLPLGHPADP